MCSKFSIWTPLYKLIQVLYFYWCLKYAYSHNCNNFSWSLSSCHCFVPLQIYSENTIPLTFSVLSRFIKVKVSGILYKYIFNRYSILLNSTKQRDTLRKSVMYLFIWNWDLFDLIKCIKRCRKKTTRTWAAEVWCSRFIIFLANYNTEKVVSYIVFTKVALI